MLVGYMRVSTDGDRQTFDLQRDALLAAGVDERCLFEDRSAAAAASARAWPRRSPLSSPAIAWSYGSWIGWGARCLTCLGR